MNNSNRSISKLTDTLGDELLQGLLEAAPDALVIVDQVGLIVRVNSQIEKVFGYARDEILGQTVERLMPERFRQKHPANRAGFIAERRVRRMGTGLDLYGRRKDGSEFPVEVSLGWLETEEGVLVTAAIRDMTERKESERRIETQLQRLEALRQIDIAITGSFDLRLVLNAVSEQATARLGVHAACVLLLSPHASTLSFAAGRGFRTSTPGKAVIRLGEGFAGRAALERRIIQVNHSSQLYSNPEFSALWASEGFVVYYGVPLIAKGRVKGVLEVFHRAPLESDDGWLNFLEALAGQAAIAIDNAQLFEGLQRSNIDLSLAYDATIEGWSHAMDLRDKETEGHTRRVTELTERLARAVGIGDEQLVHIRRGALLHDIGKMGVPDQILLKPDNLTDDEWKIMRQHPQLALDMLTPIAFLRPALDIPGCHHEKWDGTGYPHGLKGEQIPLAARIFAVVDVWDALRSDRPYRSAWPEQKALEHIRSLSGTHFDPTVVDLFLRVIGENVVDRKQ